MSKTQRLVRGLSRRLARRLSRFSSALLLIGISALPATAGQADKKLDVYWIDCEGGAATLIVTPAGESVLIDTGNPGGRDSARILAAIKSAGLKRIDHLVTTHYHIDHFGGAAEIAAALPIRNIYDNADQNPAREKPSPEYLAIKAEKRVLLNPGDRIPLQKTDTPLSIQCLAARKKLIDAPPGAKPNEHCKDTKGKPQDLSDNANSVVLLLQFGDFRFFDAGDLTWNVEHDLACPVNRVGTVDVYQVTHHGLDQSNHPALVKALEPTVAVMTNGTSKGCGPETMTTLTATPSVKAIYQSHKNLRPDGDKVNTAPEFIANMEKDCQANLIQMSVAPDAKTYTLSIPATQHERTYQTRKHQ